MPQFQQVVNANLPTAVPGELYDSAPVKCETRILQSAQAAYNLVGAIGCTEVAGQDGVAQAGNPTTTGVWAGILANPKVYALYASQGSPYTPSMNIPNNVTAELVTMGSMCVLLTNATGNIGDMIIMNNTTGLLSSQAVGAVPGGSTSCRARIDRFNATNNTAIISLNPAYT